MTAVKKLPPVYRQLPAAEIFASRPRNEPLSAMAEILDFNMFGWRKSKKATHEALMQGDNNAANESLALTRGFEDRALDVMKAMIPYVRPKLASMTISAEVEHRFVLIAPATKSSTEEWLSSAQAVVDIDDLN